MDAIKISKSAQDAYAESDKKICSDYYIHSRSNNNSHPLVDMIEPRSLRTRALLFDDAIGPDVAPYRFAFADPIPKCLRFADHHKEPAPLVTDKIKEAIEEDVKDSCEFVPAQIEGPEEIRPYWLIHSLKCHDVIDEERSVYKTLKSGGIYWMDKFVIDCGKMDSIDIKERMLFRLHGSSVLWLWHADVVRKIEATDSTGIRFFPATGYGQDAIFTP